MITFLLLLIGLIGLATIGVTITLIFGSSFLILFGDLIICILIILGIVKLFEKKDK